VLTFGHLLRVVVEDVAVHICVPDRHNHLVGSLELVTRSSEDSSRSHEHILVAACERIRLGVPGLVDRAAGGIVRSAEHLPARNVVGRALPGILLMKHFPLAMVRTTISWKSRTSPNLGV
jgi:hypothetical protein